MIDFSKHLVIVKDVLLQAVGEEAILLNLNTRQYYSLNPAGRRMVEVLTSGSTMEEALVILTGEYAVEPAVLRTDLQELVEDLLKQELVELAE